LARGEKLPEELEALIQRAVSHDPAARQPSAVEMMRDLVGIVEPAPREEVSSLVRDLASAELALRASYGRQSTPSIESGSLEPEARAVLDVLTRATMTRDAPVATGATGTSETKRWIAPVSALAVLATVGAAVTGVAVVKGRKLAGAAPPAVTSGAPSAAESASGSIAKSADSASAPPPQVHPPEAPSGSVVRAGKHRKPGVKPPAGTPNTPVSTTSKPDCTLPYVTDEEGHRHYKAECLK
jgi:serine/threonine-protein kinase